jgi:hypothetical protein
MDPLSLGAVEVTDDGMAFAYDDPEARNLVNQYRGVAISIEPASDDDPGISQQIIYSGQIPEEQLSRLRLMFSVARDLPLQEAVLEGVARQSITYDSHLDNTIHAIEGTPSEDYGSDTGGGDAAAEPDLETAKLHAEHVINIIVGRESLEFGDYNGSGRPENPGDGVGLENYLLVLQESALAASSAVVDNADAVEIAGSINGHVNELLLIITDAKNDELSVTAADNLEEVQPLAEDMKALFIEEAIQTLLDEAQSLDLAIQIDVLPVQR